MSTRSTAGLTAGFIALALFGAACSSASGPEVVAPTNAVAESTDSGPNTESAVANEPSADTETESASEAESASENSGEAVQEAEVEQPAIPAPEALQFTAPLVGGGEIDLAAGFDNKPTVFWFWAPN